ncbi:MAG: anti-sigma factor family protein [Actinomycetota bacterium]
MSCERCRELIPEVALGASSGEERALVLEHLDGCAECRSLLHELSMVADELLLLAPVQEPPPGFETRSLVRLTAERGSRRRRYALLAAAAALVIAVASSSAVWFATKEDRELGTHHRSVLAGAGGSYFGSMALAEPGGRETGRVFYYSGRTDWVFIVVGDSLEEGSFAMRAVTSDGTSMRMNDFELSADKRTWGAELPAEPGKLAALRMVEVGHERVYVATFPRSDQ